MNCDWLNGFFDSDECAVCRRFSAWCPRLRGCRSCATSAGTDGDAGGVEVAAEGFRMYADVHSGRVYCVLIRCAVASGVGNRLLLALHCDDRIGGPRRWQGAPSRSSRPLSRRHRGCRRSRRRRWGRVRYRGGTPSLPWPSPLGLPYA